MKIYSLELKSGNETTVVEKFTNRRKADTKRKQMIKEYFTLCNSMRKFTAEPLPNVSFRVIITDNGGISKEALIKELAEKPFHDFYKGNIEVCEKLYDIMEKNCEHSLMSYADCKQFYDKYIGTYPTKEDYIYGELAPYYKVNIAVKPRYYIQVCDHYNATKWLEWALEHGDAVKLANDGYIICRKYYTE